MIYCIDLDDTICRSKKNKDGSSDYKNAELIEGAREKINELFNEGNHIIIHTARHMLTCKGDIDLVEKKIKSITESWLKEKRVRYHSLIFGKPYADIYIDDKGFKFKNWKEIK